MATITDRLGHFAGQIGPVVFTNGTGSTNDPDMVAYFAADPDRWDVNDAAPSWSDLTTDQLAEAYALNVGGNATSPRGHLKALNEL
jgi:hypothetical protein